MKVIQVGLGAMGKTWIETVRRSSEVQFAAWVEVDPALGQKRAADYGFAPNLVFTSLEAALEGVQADGILDVTPPAAHKSVSFAAMERGIPVLSEKPLSGTRADAQAIVDKSNATGVLHMVTQNYRYTPLAQTVKRVLDNRALGAVGAVSVEFYKGPHFGGFREEMPYPLVVDMAIHHFDMLRFFLGSSPQRIFATSWNPSWSWYKGDASVAISAVFSHGIHVNYAGSWCAQAQETSWNANWRFECANGVLTVEDDAVYTQIVTGVEARSGYQHVSNCPKTQVPLVAMEHQAQDYLLHEFVEAVTQGKPPATTCQDNIHTIHFVFDVVQSIETGTVVAR
jgi:predicted dehydrogenase